MLDRQPTPGLEGRFKMTKEDGASSFVRLEMADNPLAEGTPLNKSTLLKDKTAALFGFGQSAVPDDVLNFLGAYNTHWWKRTMVSTGVSSYINSADRSAYPDSGENGGYEWEYLGVPFENAVTAPMVSAGTYTGTGTYGETNPSSLSFPFAPKCLIIAGNDGYLGVFPNLTTSYTTYTTHTVNGSDHMIGYTRVRVNGTTVERYAAGSPAPESTWMPRFQANASGMVYHYIAIG